MDQDDDDNNNNNNNSADTSNKLKAEEVTGRGCPTNNDKKNESTVEKTDAETAAAVAAFVPICQEGDRPQKKFYRQRAHCNPLSHNDSFEYPLRPDLMDWTTEAFYPGLKQDDTSTASSSNRNIVVAHAQPYCCNVHVSILLSSLWLLSWFLENCVH
jgi:hypothetical protein